LHSYFVVGVAFCISLNSVAHSFHYSVLSSADFISSDVLTSFMGLFHWGFSLPLAALYPAPVL